MCITEHQYFCFSSAGLWRGHVDETWRCRGASRGVQVVVVDLWGYSLVCGVKLICVPDVSPSPFRNGLCSRLAGGFRGYMCIILRVLFLVRYLGGK